MLLVAAGCASSPGNIAPDATPRLDSGTGVVVGTVTAQSVHHYHRQVAFFLRRAGGGMKGRLDSAVPQPLFPFESRPDDGLVEENGRIFACELPEGVYEIHEVRLLGSPAIVLVPSAPPQFEVRAGEVGYLGNLDVAFEVAPVSGVRSAIRGGTPSFRDRSARDLPLVRAQFPGLAGLEIVPRVIDGGGAAWARD